MTNSFKENVLKHLWSFSVCIGVVFFLNTMMVTNLPMGSDLVMMKILDQAHFAFILIASAVFSVTYMGVVARKKSLRAVIVVFILAFTPFVIGGLINLPHDGRVVGISLLTLTVSLLFFSAIWRWK